jgi:cytochrome P450
MLLHPEAQKKAQDEITSVLGTELESLPKAEDQSRLPYVEACWKESLRWHPALPDGVAHQTRSDMMHGRYYIPKGAILLSNIWWVC